MDYKAIVTQVKKAAEARKISLLASILTSNGLPRKYDEENESLSSCQKVCRLNGMIWMILNEMNIRMQLSGLMPEDLRDFFVKPHPIGDDYFSIFPEKDDTGDVFITTI